MGKLSLSGWKAQHLHKLNHSPTAARAEHGPLSAKSTDHAEHVEDVVDIRLPLGDDADQTGGEETSEQASATRALPFQSARVPNERLPFIAAADVKRYDGEMTRSGQQNRLCIVVDNIVLDVTEYQAKHPGGRAILSGFGGSDCSWQWWSFHGKGIWDSVANRLRVGQTEGVKNPHKQPPRIVGLRSHGFNDWD